MGPLELALSTAKNSLPSKLEDSPTPSSSTSPEKRKDNDIGIAISARNRSHLRPSMGTETGSDDAQKTTERIRTAVRAIIGRKAIELKKEMKERVRAIESRLEEYLKQLKIQRDLIRTLDEDIRKVEAQNGNGSLLMSSLDEDMNTSVLAVKKILEQVEEEKEYLERLKKSWDYFRQEYKDKVVLAVIQNEIRKQKDTEWAAFTDKAVNWYHFLPDFMKKEIDTPSLFVKHYCIETSEAIDELDNPGHRHRGPNTNHGNQGSSNAGRGLQGGHGPNPRNGYQGQAPNKSYTGQQGQGPRSNYQNRPRPIVG